MTIKLEDIKTNELINGFIKSADEYLGVLGYTEHGFRHVTFVSETSKYILEKLGYDDRTCELAAIAGYIHDIGNVINRKEHGQSSAIIAMEILSNLGFPAHEIAKIISAIGNHEEEVGEPVNEVSAALILADKSDVHKSRVRNPNMISFDIHDRVNYAVEKSLVEVFPKEKIVSVRLTVDTNISKIIEYFEIFMPRIIICRRAANYFGCNYELVINDQKVL
jgi:metal-dependent HD superfamily phosphatase/phosphodiesterase